MDFARREEIKIIVRLWAEHSECPEVADELFLEMDRLVRVVAEQKEFSRVLYKAAMDFAEYIAKGN